MFKEIHSHTVYTKKYNFPQAVIEFKQGPQLLVRVHAMVPRHFSDLWMVNVADNMDQ